MVHELPLSRENGKGAQVKTNGWNGKESESGQWAKLAAVALQWLCPRQQIAACVVGKRKSESEGK